jgi:prepilin-type N-terminal cleavage/methylation domain-containing protein/prepilin-type processing-associated H-X9-DG protein
MRKKLRSRPDCGFTLIEVLVVVAIIALLISILAPSLAEARRQSRASVCLSNMRQLGVAAHMYATVSKGMLMDYGLAHGGSVDETTTWFNSLRREYGNKLVARCPEDRSPYWTDPYPQTTQLRRVSYGVNEYLTGRLPGYERFRSIDAIRRPATTILFSELTQLGEYAVSDHVHPVNWALNPLAEAKKQIEPELHSGRANYVFADSHAEPQRFDQTFKVNGRTRVGPKLVFDWGHNMYDPKVGY